MSIAYLDPGNIESDLRSGSVAKFKVGTKITGTKGRTVQLGQQIPRDHWILFALSIQQILDNKYSEFNVFMSRKVFENFCEIYNI